MRVLATLLLTILCIGLSASHVDPTKKDNPNLSPTVETNASASTTTVTTSSFYFPELAFIPEVSSPQKYNCGCSGYWSGSHSIKCQTGQTCSCKIFIFSCRCRCTAGDSHAGDPDPR